MSVERLFLPEAAAALRAAIAEAGGNEVLAVGGLDSEGRVDRVTVAARGNAEAVPALEAHLARGEVVVHNHPDGRLEPSGPDFAVASRLGAQGIGFYIVDNALSRVYVVAEPIQARPLAMLEPGRLSGLLRQGGGLAAIYPDFEERSSQVRMLEFAAEGFNRGELRAAEAGTGVGKSLAYLIPAFQWALENGERVVVSTATINLQQQLVEKDIPLTVRLLGRNPGYYLVKGRGNYLCRTRLKEALEETSLFEEERQEGLAEVAAWARVTPTGSRTDLSPYPNDELWSRVNSEADACHGLRCPNREGCFVLKARREAAAARILVANHHLLFADLSLRLAGTGFEAAAVLPPFQHIVFDEAHNIEKNASSYFSAAFSRAQVSKYAGRLYREKGRKRHGLLLGLERVFGQAASGLRQAVLEVVNRAQELEAAARPVLAGRPAIRFTAAEAALLDPLAELARSIAVLGALFDGLVGEAAEAAEAEAENYFVYECRIQLRRLAGAAEIAQRFQHSGESRTEVFWLEGRKDRLGEVSVRFLITPLSIAPMMTDAVYRPYRSVLFTSATLTVGGGFDYWKSRIGLNQVRFRETAERQFPSPFDYAGNVLLGIPAEAPEPAEADFASFATSFIGQALAISQGHALVLFTSYALLEQVHRVVAPECGSRGIAVLRQGQDDRARLLARFQGDAASVLLATDSFWEGVDAPGETLELLILTRLPFRVPDDPVLAARMQMIQERGGNPFLELSLPDAIMRLRQGFGRLMRRQEDSGAVLILDSRVVRRPYGALFLESLPRCRMAVGSSGEVLAALREMFAVLKKKRAHRFDALPAGPEPGD